ncbi:MAG: pyruvate/2-oxoglutarate dehydrogenase complex dihydrolipoamide acyltransferase (E2) component [Halioglobus sp.]|jgi:pyruvate/2-oxoglutarate dehydrogenase complex dihydrolipoamide acyltransferase (E2) component
MRLSGIKSIRKPPRLGSAEISAFHQALVLDIGGANRHRNWVGIPHVTNHDDADQKSVMDVAQEVSALAAKAREGKLTVDQMNGGCVYLGRVLADMRQVL